jgi:hypothetical protein
MPKADGSALPDIDDAQDGAVGSYASPSASLLPSAVTDNAPKCLAAAFILLCFLCFGPRGIAMAAIVLAALRVTLAPVSSTSASRSSSTGSSGSCPPPPLPPPRPAPRLLCA